MKVSLEDISSVKKKMIVNLPSDLVDKEIDNFYRELNRKVKIKGFRPGKVPRNILERYYKDVADREVASNLIKKSYKDALSEVVIDPVAPPEIEQKELKKGEPFVYEAIVEIKPEIDVKGYEHMSLTTIPVEVKEEEVLTTLKELQENNAILKEPKPIRPAKKGDVLIIDYVAKANGEDFNGNQGHNFIFEIGKNSLFPGLDEKLIGSAPGEEYEFDIEIPSDYQIGELAGKKVNVKVVIKDLKEKIISDINDEFAKSLGEFKDLNDLKEKIRNQLRERKEKTKDELLKNDIIEQLIKENPFEIPESLVVQKARIIAAEALNNLAKSGVDLKGVDIENAIEKMAPNYMEQARKDVKAEIILDAIAQKENIDVSNDDLEKEYKRISSVTDQGIELIRSYYKNNNLEDQLKQALKHEKVFQKIILNAEITETKKEEVNK